MNFAILLILLYLLSGIAMVFWDFRSNNTLHDPPRFIHDRSVSTAVVFILVWPYKLLKR